MFGEIRVALEGGGAAPRFRLTAPDGGTPRVTLVSVTDLATQDPIWWLVPASFVSVLPFTIQEVDEEAVQALAAMDEVDPIEDLPASDPRHQRALQEADALQRGILVPLAQVIYGEVPSGFRQARPRDGAPPALVPGREYVLTVMGGSDAGHCAFQGA